MDYIKIEDMPEEFVGLANFMGIDKFIEFCKNITIYDQTAAAISGQSFLPHHLQTGYAV